MDSTLWDLSCPDWAERIKNGESLIPDLPLFKDEADAGLAFFDGLRLPDVHGLPFLRDAAGGWFRQLVHTVCGARNPETNERMIREVFALVPKGQSKTSYSAGLIVTLLLMNLRPRAAMLFVGPTQAISDLAYSQAVGMIEADDELRKRFVPREHKKQIFDLVTKSVLSVKTFDLKILTGPKPVVVLLDELHLLGKNPHASKVIRQIRGGLEKNPEGLLMIISTQSDEAPAGAFRDELLVARKIRDGKFKGRMLPLLYEFPPEIARDPSKWQNSDLWSMVMPNLGRSMWLPSLIQDWEAERVKGTHAISVWASQHLNIEIGVGLMTDRWAGADFWSRQARSEITFEALLERCEVIVIGLDGGGLDDLFGFAALGRERETKKWLLWSHAWCHQGVLERRQAIASRLNDFREAEELTIVDDRLQDEQEIVALIVRVNDAGLLAAVAADAEGPLGQLVDELDKVGITVENGQLVAVRQGYGLMNAIKYAERRLANGTLEHSDSSLMDWCVGNVKIEPTATAIRATKQNAGDAKIDPWMAAIDAVAVMATNPEALGGAFSETYEIPVWA